MKKFLSFFAVLLALTVPASAQWQVDNNAVPLGKGAGKVGFGKVLGSSGGGTKCLLDTVPPSFGTCVSAVVPSAGVVHSNGSVFSGLADFTTSIFYAASNGAVCDGVTNDTTAIQATITAAEASGGIVQLPRGKCLLNTGLTCTKPITIKGVGSGAGPGVPYQGESTVLLANFLTGDVISCTGYYAFTFKDFQIASNVGARSSGAGIHVTGGVGNNNQSTLIDNITLHEQYIGIQLTSTGNPTVQRTNHYNPVLFAIYCEAVTGVEASCGQIQGNAFFDLTNSTTAVIESHVGYTTVKDNAIIGGQTGIRFNIDTINAGKITVSNNIIENQRDIGVYLVNGGGFQASNVSISNNEFFTSNATMQGNIVVADADPNWVFNLQVNNNTHRGQLTCGCGSWISFSAGINVQVIGNVIEAFGGSTQVGIGNGGHVAAPIQVLDNQFTGVTTRYSLNNLTTVRDQLGVLTATLLGWNFADGSQFFATDADPATACTHAGAQTGAMAFRQNGAWKCF